MARGYWILIRLNWTTLTQGESQAYVWGKHDPLDKATKSLVSLFQNITQDNTEYNDENSHQVAKQNARARLLRDVAAAKGHAIHT